MASIRDGLLGKSLRECLKTRRDGLLMFIGFTTCFWLKMNDIDILEWPWFLMGNEKNIRFDLANEWQKIAKSWKFPLAAAAYDRKIHVIQTFLTWDRSKHQTCKVCCVEAGSTVKMAEPRALWSCLAKDPLPLWSRYAMVKSISSDKNDKKICRHCCSSSPLISCFKHLQPSSDFSLKSDPKFSDFLCQPNVFLLKSSKKSHPNITSC